MNPDAPFEMLLIERRIDLLCALPFDKLDRLRLETLTRGIGEVS